MRIDDLREFDEVDALSAEDMKSMLKDSILQRRVKEREEKEREEQNKTDLDAYFNRKFNHL